MRTSRAVSYLMLSAGLVTFIACSSSDSGASHDAGASAAATPAAAPSTPRAMIMSPAEGDSVSGDSVRVMMHVEGAKIIPVDSAKSPHMNGEGHLHLFLDKDVTPANAPIPLNDPSIVHFGKGATEHVFAKLTPGPHRLIVVFAFTDHTPDMAVSADTVNIIVR